VAAKKNPPVQVQSEQAVFSFPSGARDVLCVRAGRSHRLPATEAIIVPGIFGSAKLSPRFVYLTNVRAVCVCCFLREC
jgi:hypothetical protein